MGVGRGGCQPGCDSWRMHAPLGGGSWLCCSGHLPGCTQVPEWTDGLAVLTAAALSSETRNLRAAISQFWSLTAEDSRELVCTCVVSANVDRVRGDTEGSAGHKNIQAHVPMASE